MANEEVDDFEVRPPAPGEVIARLRAEAEEWKNKAQDLQKQHDEVHSLLLKEQRNLSQLRLELKDVRDHYQNALATSKTYDVELKVYKRLYSELISKITGREQE